MSTAAQKLASGQKGPLRIGDSVPIAQADVITAGSILPVTLRPFSAKSATWTPRDGAS
jgi:hypothetical protein